MKKLLAVGMLAAFAVPASAATLSLGFVGGDTDTKATVPQGGSITVAVFFEFTDATDATDGINAISFNMTTAPESPDAGQQGELAPDGDLQVVGGSGVVGPSLLGGWTVVATAGAVGGFSQFSGFGTVSADSFYTVGTTLVGTFEIDILPTAALGPHPFYIQRKDAAFSPSVSNENALPYSFNLSGDGYDGKYNIGNGFAGKNNGSGAIPMVINVTPEPAALALLALGGVAVLRRRS